MIDGNIRMERIDKKVVEADVYKKMKNKKLREIKFRARFKPDQKMFDVVTLVRMGDEEGVRVFPKTSAQLKDGVLNRSTEDWEIELMQSTGVYDINGKEIYRWDIIKSQWDIREVRYNSDMASFIGVRSKEIQSVDDWVSLEFVSEVIWNIYENPELATWLK